MSVSQRPEDLAEVLLDGVPYGPSRSVATLTGLKTSTIRRLRASGALPYLDRGAVGGEPGPLRPVGRPAGYLYDLEAAAEVASKLSPRRARSSHAEGDDPLLDEKVRDEQVTSLIEQRDELRRQNRRLRRLLAALHEAQHDYFADD